MLQTRRTHATSEQPCRFYRLARPHRRTCKLQQKSIHWCRRRIEAQCAAIKQAVTKLSPPPAKLVKRMDREVVLPAEPGPSGWRTADTAAIGRSEGGPAVLRNWIGTWTQTLVPHHTAKLWTAATIVPLDRGPKKPEPGQQMPQLCPRRLRPIALAEVPMKLIENCVIERQNPASGRTYQFGTRHARCTGADCSDRAWLGERHSGSAQGGAGRRRLVGLENARGRVLRSTCLEAARRARSLQQCALLNGNLAIPGSGNDAMTAGWWTARREADDKVREPCRSCSCSGWNLPSPSSTPKHRTESRGLGYPSAGPPSPGPPSAGPPLRRHRVGRCTRPILE